MPNGGIQVDIAPAGRVTLATVRGEIDIASSDDLARMLNKVETGKRLILDLSAVDFMDSSGLAVVLRQSMRRRDAGGSLHIRQPSHSVRRLLEFCCLEHLLEPERATRTRTRPKSP
jgi:stage II sporulation protein AA (anti-sigma F factor antagonist)